MSETESTLGKSLPELALHLDDLFDAATDGQQRTNISIMQKRVHALLEPLIDANLDKADQDYKAAVAGVRKATEAIKAAVSDLQKVAQAINTVASAIGLLDGVVTKL